MITAAGIALIGAFGVSALPMGHLIGFAYRWWKVNRRLRRILPNIDMERLKTEDPERYNDIKETEAKFAGAPRPDAME